MYMLDVYIVLRSLASLLLIVLSIAVIYILAGLASPRGRHSELARKPFTGGISLPQIPHRYFTDMIVFVAVFLLSESITLLLFLAADSPLVAATILLGAIGVFLPAILLHRR